MWQIKGRIQMNASFVAVRTGAFIWNDTMPLRERVLLTAVILCWDNEWNLCMGF